MSWVQGFNQPYPGALQYLQTGGFLPTRSFYGRPRSRNPNPNWGRARAPNFQGGIGAIGPAIGLSPMVYGIPFPGYPSLAQQQKVGVSPAESEQWREVYAAQMRDRGVLPNPARIGRLRNAMPMPPGCRIVWTYEGPCPPGTVQRGEYWAEDGEDLGQICCPRTRIQNANLRRRQRLRRSTQRRARLRAGSDPTVPLIDLECPGGGDIVCTPKDGGSVCKCKRCSSSHGVTTCIEYDPQVKGAKKGMGRLRSPNARRRNLIESIAQIPEPWTILSSGGGL